ncbi:MAG TPA: IPT/TIG domain-containing protein [Bryobacteraceae bacterium]
MTNAAVFSATGDALGYVNVSGQGTPYQHLVASFSSPSGGIGQLPRLPVFVITVPVLSSAATGTTSTITIDPTVSPWVDPQGVVYAVLVSSASFTVGGTLSIQNVSPGGGLLPSGTPVTINGAGFDASTIVIIDGVALSSTQFVSPQQINVVLNGAYEMTARHVHVQTGGGAKADFFCSLSSVPANVTSPAVLPLIPLTTYTNVLWQYVDDNEIGVDSVAILNQNLNPETATIFFVDASGVVEIAPSITIQPGQLSFASTAKYNGSLGELEMVSSAPMRMVEYGGPVVPDVSLGGVFPPTWLPSLPLQLQPWVSPSNATWTWQIGTAEPAPVVADVDAFLPFTVAVSVPWLSVSPAQGAGPMTLLTFTPDLAHLTAGTYTGTVNLKTTIPAVLSGLTLPDVVIAVSIKVIGSSSIVSTANPSVSVASELAVAPASTGSVPLSAFPASLSLVENTGTSEPGVTLVYVQPMVSFTTSVQTQSGGNWLMASYAAGNCSVVASAGGLSPGTYLGTITLTSTANGSVQIPVTLKVLAVASPLTVSPSSLALTLQAGQTGTQSFSVSSPVSTFFSQTPFQPGGQQWITQIIATPTNTPSTVTITFGPQQPGTYYGSVTVTSGSSSVTIPITLTVTASPAFPPMLGSIVSAASGLPSAISPGQIITLYGSGIGSTPAGLFLTPGGKVATTLGGTQVLINNIAAPLIYESSSQVNAIVPYEVPSSGVATVQVTSSGLQSPTWSVPLAPAEPSIFTAGSTGLGQAAILNQDSSINSASNPAAIGSTVQIFATGGGQTSPASVTGSVASANMSLLPVTVTIGGQTAAVTYQGSAPGEVAGVLQVDAVVPAGISSGADVLALTVNGQHSQPSVTIAIK